MINRLIEKTCLWVLSWVSRDPDGNRHVDIHWPSNNAGHFEGFDEGYFEGRRVERELWERLVSQ